MSETMTKQNEETRKTYKVEMDPIPFEADCDTKYSSSTEFCKLANEYFREVFADYIGSTFDFDNGVPTISLYFSHADFSNSALPTAVQRVDKKDTGSNLLNKTRFRDLQYKEGDRFVITDDGIDIIKPLLMPKLYNGGNVNWKNIVVDHADRNMTNMYNPAAQQTTKIKGIDPKNICRLLYGNKAEDGSFIDYGVMVQGAINMGYAVPGNNPANYVLMILRGYNDHIQKTCEKFGITNGMSTIIR